MLYFRHSELPSHSYAFGPWYTLQHLQGTHSTASLANSLPSCRCLLMPFPTGSPPGLCSGFPCYVDSLWHPLYCFIVFCCCLYRDCRLQWAVTKSILYTVISLALSTVQHIVNKYLLNKRRRGEGEKSAVWTNRKGGHRERASILSQHSLGFFGSCEIHSVEFPKDVERSSVKQLSPKLC